jgi:dienelactone hydrolase
VPPDQIEGLAVTEFSLRRRGLLAGALALAATPTLLSPTLARAEATTTTIKVADRDVELTLVRPEAPKGVVVFSHGAGAWPAGYAALLDLWAKAGFLVVAPLHVDSQKHPKRADYTLRTAFPARLADLAGASAYAAQAAPGLPVAAAGHSYGSLMSLIRGGALTGIIPAQDPSVKAVLCFSSPGVIRSLITPTAYQGVTGPMMMITGDKDVMPGVFDDLHEHLYPFETSPAGDKYAWIGQGVDHRMAHHADAPGFAEAAALSATFLKAQVLGDATAKAALASQGSTATAEFRRR